MRVSSVMWPASSCGTFRSARMKTRWPATLPAAMRSVKRRTFMMKLKVDDKVTWLQARFEFDERMPLTSPSPSRSGRNTARPASSGPSTPRAPEVVQRGGQPRRAAARPARWRSAGPAVITTSGTTTAASAASGATSGLAAASRASGSSRSGKRKKPRVTTRDHGQAEDGRARRAQALAHALAPQPLAGALGRARSAGRRPPPRRSRPRCSACSGRANAATAAAPATTAGRPGARSVSRP